ncbi:MAG: glycosyltransferase [Candidatus Eremiobacteraeota bacterium]|nr:glycosyltransferase [Candidatus Eremiobacteraeota bacterium]
MTEKSTTRRSIPRPWVVACFELPGYGGAAGMAHRLTEALNRVHPTVCLNLIEKRHSDYYLYRFGEHAFNPLGLPYHDTCKLEGSHADQREQVRACLDSWQPLLVLAVGYVAGRLLVEGGHPFFYLAWGCREIGFRLESGRFRGGSDLSSLEKAGPGRETEVVERADYVICNSTLLLGAFSHLWPDWKGKIHPVALSLQSLVEEDLKPFRTLSKPFHSRDIDVLFSASNWDRSIKNFSLVKHLLKLLAPLKVRVLGEGSHPNAEGLVTDRHEYFSLVGRSKAVVCPSLFDAAPGVLFEARSMGCNVVASSGCGNAFPEEIVEDRPRSYLEAIHRAILEPPSGNTALEDGEDIVATLPEIIQVFQQVDPHGLLKQPSEIRRPPEPEFQVDISMPARNEEHHIQQALRSLLAQAGVSLRIFVVDDASTDRTVERVLELKDPRIRLIQNSVRMGIGWCHNRVMDESSAPFVCHVDADDWVLPGAVHRLVSTLQSCTQAGMAHCWYLTVDERGECTREEFERQHSDFSVQNDPLNYERLLRKKCVINHLRTYRREALEIAGSFRENLEIGEDWDMALRLLARGFQIRQVRRFLYCYRLHTGNHSEKGALRLRSFLPGRSKLGWRWPRALGRAAIKKRVSRLGETMTRNAAPRLSVLLSRALSAFYSRCRSRFAGIELKFGKRSSASARLGYHLGIFPILSETFVRREIQALRETGLELFISARSSSSDYPSDPNTFYLEPLKVSQILTAFLSVFARRPFTTASALCYCWSQGRGNVRSDLRDLALATLVARWALSQRLTHLHAPWGNEAAFHAMVAASIAGVAFSFQIRAYELHRNGGVHVLNSLLSQSPLVITNCHYNREALKSRVKGKLTLVREGLPLQTFQRAAREGSVIFSLGRLVPQKGLRYLLQAAALLQEQGHSFDLIIGGGREDRWASCYLELHQLRRKLGLEDRVQFLGPISQDRARALMHSSDIFVLPCVVAPDGARDITPNTLMEAMACGLPVVSTRITAIPEVVQDGGILVPPGCSDALAGALEQLLTDPKLAENLGRRAREIASECFDIDRTASELRQSILEDEQIK